MDIEKQVATLEQSKRLKELGVEIKNPMVFWAPDSIDETKYVITSARFMRTDDYHPAPTAEEIAELLPHKLKNKYLDVSKMEKGWQIRYPTIAISNEVTLVLAMTSMLIWLIENNHINPKELNGK